MTKRKGLHPYEGVGYELPSTQDIKIDSLEKEVKKLESKLTKLIKLLYNKDFRDRGYKEGDMVPTRTWSGKGKPFDQELTDLL